MQITRFERQRLVEICCSRLISCDDFSSQKIGLLGAKSKHGSRARTVANLHPWVGQSCKLESKLECVQLSSRTYRQGIIGAGSNPFFLQKGSLGPLENTILLCQRKETLISLLYMRVFRVERLQKLPLQHRCEY